MRKFIFVLSILLGVLIGITASTSIASAAPNIGRDKYEHVETCYGIEYTLSQCKPFAKWKHWQRALFTTAVIGGGKEWYDARHPEHHTAEWGDIAADAAGAFGAEGTIWLLHKTW